jgi:hypothetical protein
VRSGAAVIVSDAGDHLVLVRQVDHQDQCAAMARAWEGAGFERLPHHAAVVTAAALHDEGWRSWEERPQVGADGGPLDFPAIDRAEHVALYRAGIDEVCRRDPRAGLLVSMHGSGLYRGRLGLDHVVHGEGARPAAVDRFLAHEDARQAALRARLGEGPELDRWSWAAYRRLQAWDLLSLALVWGRLSEREALVLARVPRSEDDEEGVDLTVRPVGRWRATLTPWPFGAGTQEFPVLARRIPKVAHADSAALQGALERVEWETLPARVDPG